MKVLATQLNTATSQQLFGFTQGLDVDVLFFKQEVAVQIAWARGLTQLKILSEQDFHAIIEAFSRAEDLVKKGEFQWRVEDEDIHMNLERFMIEQVGELGKKIHFGRSRNDLIATTLRLFVRDSMQEIEKRSKAFAQAVIHRCDPWLEVIVPGMTHLQSGQPIRFGHAFAAHAHAVGRDLERLERARDAAMATMPTGAAAFAGTHLAIDLQAIAVELGFKAPLANSYDAVGDRDFFIEALNAMAIMAMHLSRYCSEVMYWSSTAVGLLQLPMQWSTGSSIMPNKRNPDVPELVRAKSARIIAAANEGMMLVRSVVPSYGSDLHELKRTFVRAFDELGQCLAILVPFTTELSINSQVAEYLCGKGHILATEIANALVENGSTFRDAYKLTAELVREAENCSKQIHEMDKTKKALNGQQFTYEQAVESRRNLGGSGRDVSRNSLKSLQHKIEAR